jgi:selenocysteine lyase/cysteine desulfurase
MPDWNNVRSQFPVTERSIYLNTGWSGPSSRAVVAAIQERVEREAYDGPSSLDVRYEKAQLVQRTRRAFASLLNATEDETALMYTTTEGVNTVLRGLGLGPGDEVITCNLEHNAVMVPSYVSRMRDGTDLKIVRFASTEDAAAMLDAFEAATSPRTKLFVLSEISFNRGTLLPMREICGLAHARRALVAVDAAQSAGQIPVDVKEMDCDFLALPGQKWLLGPAGAAALYVRPDHLERLQPLAVVHGANRRFDYSGNFEYANDTVRKFELTTHSGPVLAGVATASEEAMARGLQATAARTRELADRFLAGLQAIDGVRITSPLDPSVRSAIVTFTVRDLDPNETVAALQDAGIVMRVCNDRRVRACFHVFNDEAEVERTLEVLANFAECGLPPGTPTAEEYKARLLEADD